MRHNKNENYKVMEDWTDRNREEVMIIDGHSNTRTAIMGGLWDSEEEKEVRKCKDKLINEEGINEDW